MKIKNWMHLEDYIEVEEIKRKIGQQHAEAEVLIRKFRQLNLLS
jgi:hypothetical protein